MSFSASVRDYTSDRAAAPLDGSIINSSPLHYVIIHKLLPSRGMVEAYHGLHVGKQVEFDVPGLGKRTAEVVEQRGAFFECAFTHPFDTDALLAKRLDAKVVWADFPKQSRMPAAQLRDLLLANDHHDERYSGVVRIGIIAGSAMALWGGISAIFWL